MSDRSTPRGANSSPLRIELKLESDPAGIAPVRRAIERILANRELEKFNSLEVVRVASLVSKRYLGIRHVTVSAQSRHIQESPVIFQVKDKDFEVPAPSGIELRPDQSLGLSGSAELPWDEIKTPNLKSVRI